MGKLSVFGVLLTIVLIFDPGIVKSQETATFRVLVTAAEDGRPVIGAHVILRSPQKNERGNFEIEYAGITDQDGFHEFSEVTAGQYRLEISFVGYKTYTEKIKLREGQRNIVQVKLETSVQQLDEVVVESEREVTTGEVGLRRISDVDISRVPTPGPSGDLASYLQTQPGVVASGDRGGDLYIRGGTPSQNKVLVDNLPVIKPFHISNLFSAFPDYNVQNIDMYAGGFGAEYHGATSAVIDVNLQPGNFQDFVSTASLSTHVTSLKLEGPIEKGRQSFMISGRKSLIETTSPTITQNTVPINFYDLTARYTYQSDNFYCNITGIHTYDRGEINPNRQVNLSWNNTAIGARCRGFDILYDHPFEITAGYTAFENTESDFSSELRSASVKQFYIKVDQEERLFGLSFDYGFGLKYRFQSARLSERFTEFETFNNSSVIPHIHASTVWQPHNNFTLRPGFVSQVTPGTYPTLEPRLRIAYTPGVDHEISLAVGKYSQDMNGITDQRDAGTVFTLYRSNDSDTPLQTASHGILGYQHELSRTITTNLEGYYKRQQNIPVSEWNPEAGLEVQTALANGSSYGFDIRVEYSRSPFFMYLGYGWSKVEYQAASDDLGAWIEEPIFKYSPPHDQRHKFNALMSYNFSGFKASLGWEFGSGKPYTQVYGFDLELDSYKDDPLYDSGTARTLFSRPYNKRLPVYHRLDASLERTFQFSGQLSIDAKIGCINVYGRDNIFYFDLNTLERVNQTPFLPYLSLQTSIN